MAVEETVNPFKAKQLEEKKRRAELKQQEDAEAERRTKEKAKETKAKQVEDDWFFDSPGGNDDTTPVSPGAGFTMLDMTAEGAPAAPSKQSDRQVIVKSLIDFDECNVADSWSAEPLDIPEADLPDHGEVNPQEVTSAFPPASFSNSNDLQLLQEIEHLQQRLKDAEEEKNIQLLMAHDDVSHERELLRSMTLERDSLRAELELERSRPAVLPAAAAAAAAAQPPALVAAITASPTEQPVSPTGGALVALRDMRMQAEKQVEWIRKQVNLSKQSGVGGTAAGS